MHTKTHSIATNRLKSIIFCASIILIFLSSAPLLAQSQVKGKITDAKTGEALAGVSISVNNSTIGTASDGEGNYELNLNPGSYTLKASYISFVTLDITDVTVKRGTPTLLDISMHENANTLNEVVVIAMQNLSSEVSLLNSMRRSTSIVSGVSSQQISKNQDRDASEVIRRIPGISIIDNKFVVARGLSQRYNNVWINNSATPSSEADTRSFSFDIIPSPQIENIMIIKSPQPELPADFSGGFVKVTTKGIPNQNLTEISYGTGINTETHFKDFKYSSGSSTDFLGFDNGFRDMKSIVPNRLKDDDTEAVDAVSKNGFNNNWDVKTKKPLPDQRFSLILNRQLKTENGQQWGLASSLNYSYNSKTYNDMKNTQYGIYNKLQDTPAPDNDYIDNQYITSTRLGAMLNLSFISDNKHRIEFRNIFNQLGQDRYTYRTGIDYTGGREKKEEKQEYLFSSRTSYTGQIAGKHDFSLADKLDWTAGFSYANKNQPDRRIINREENTSTSDDPYNGLMYISASDITRNFVNLNEYIYNIGANYTHDLNIGSNIAATIKSGLYAEHKNRDYNTRDFSYIYDQSYFPFSFRFGDVVKDILIPENYGSGKLFVSERTNNVDSYKGSNDLFAGYLAINLPVNSFNIYAGVRVEHNNMTLTNYKSSVTFDTKDTEYKKTDLFPSVNISYNLDKNNVLRAAYGMSVNRPEFREVAPASYYDFDLFNRIIGNSDLESAYIHNFDLKYEFYPSGSELISVALFYKHFKNPIEWTFINTGGGSRIYTFENALSANNTGIELDIKKQLDFVGLKNFSIVFNGSLIDSKVKFGENSIEEERALQGQSPFLLNTGLFYQNDKLQLTAGVMYNVIGKRIVGIGLKNKSENSTIGDDIPDMYEMPRNVIDFTISKKLGSNFEISFACKDILAQDMVYKQFPKFDDADGVRQEREQITKKYKVGQNLSISAKYSF